MGTGEHPMVDQHTPVRLGPVVTLVAALLGVAAAAGAAHYRLGAAERGHEKHEQADEVMRATQGAHETRIRLVEDGLGRQEKALERIEAKLDRAVRPTRDPR